MIDFRSNNQNGQNSPSLDDKQEDLSKIPGHDMVVTLAKYFAPNCSKTIIYNLFSIPEGRKWMHKLRLSVTSQKSLRPFTPYLNFDPTYLPTSQPEFIFPEGAVKQRGRFELAFSQIGGTCMTGAAVGGVTGLYKGFNATALAGHRGKLRRTQLINHVVKHGASMASTLGVVSVMYSCFGVLLSYVRGNDDSLNTLAAATATGMLFKSTAGLQKCLRGGGVGLGLASLYCLWTNREVLLPIKQNYMNPA